MKSQNQNKYSWLYFVIGVIVTLLVVWGLTSGPSKSQTANPANPPTVQPATVNTTISDSPYLGDKSKAKVAIIEFSDYECPYCKQFFEQEFDQVKSNFVDTNKAIFVYRDFAGVGGTAAETDSNAALCVRKLKDNPAYFQMAKLIYQNTGLEGQGIPSDKMNSLATQVGVDQTKFSDCVKADTFKDTIQKDTQDATSIGVNGTPSFLIGKLDASGKVTGDLQVGVIPISAFQTEVDKFSK